MLVIVLKILIVEQERIAERLPEVISGEMYLQLPGGRSSS